MSKRQENPEDILPSLADLSRYPLVTADEYLSGKVRQKLRMAKAFLEVAPDNQKETARRNVEALEAVQPQDLGAGEIGVRIGANWVPIEVYHTSHRNRRGCKTNCVSKAIKY